MNNVRGPLGRALFSPILIAVLTNFGLFGSVNAQNGTLINEDAPRVTKAQRLQIRQLKRELNAKVEPVAKRDPRYVNYLKDVEKLKKIKDHEELEKAFAEFTTNYAGFRDDVLREAKVDIKAFNLRLQKILPRIKLNDTGMIEKVASVTKTFPDDEDDRANIWMNKVSYVPIMDTTTTTVYTTFPQKWSYQDCPANNAETTFENSRSLSSYSETDVNNDDCSNVKAARGVIVHIPSGTTRIRISVEVDQFNFHTWVGCWGVIAYADAYASVGIRFRKRGSNVPTQYSRHSYAESEWSVLGDSSKSKTETDAIFNGTFGSFGAGNYDVQAFARTNVDTDGFATSHSGSSISGMQKITVTIER